MVALWDVPRDVAQEQMKNNARYSIRYCIIRICTVQMLRRLKYLHTNSVQKDVQNRRLFLTTSELRLHFWGQNIHGNSVELLLLSESLF